MKDTEHRHLDHGFGPVFDEHSRILILGSFPSVASRAVSFYYGHKQNRFWPLLCELLQEPLPGTVEEKRLLVLRRNIALWDSIESCDIVGSSDSSIKNAVPTDIMRVLRVSPVEKIFCNGVTSGRVYEKYLFPVTGIHAGVLPSTSPANAASGMEALKEKWKAILPYLEN